ncbi:hypothetical protein [Vibrio barjaei]|uniref:hypothetical protein n=1 Tax=Vibrio barjaei TaxID=1676683 RepID=UPI002283DF1F|nr:hypothetical protein [Vibrio barjaei]MCY9873856.1 hypothetical protein [Vibrio barjaei]
MSFVTAALVLSLGQLTSDVYTDVLRDTEEYRSAKGLFELAKNDTGIREQINELYADKFQDEIIDNITNLNSVVLTDEALIYDYKVYSNWDIDPEMNVSVDRVIDKTGLDTYKQLANKKAIEAVCQNTKMLGVLDAGFYVEYRHYDHQRRQLARVKVKECSPIK